MKPSVQCPAIGTTTKRWAMDTPLGGLCTPPSRYLPPLPGSLPVLEHHRNLMERSPDTKRYKITEGQKPEFLSPLSLINNLKVT